HDHGQLYPAEAAAIAGAAPTRRGEFTGVRVCAREALVRAGLPRAPLVPGPTGAPAWPAGVVGSMTHCDGYRACALGRAGGFAALASAAGPPVPLPAGVLGLVASASERAALALLAERWPFTRWDRIVFSAKESVYKAWSPATGRWLGYDQADVVLDPATQT